MNIIIKSSAGINTVSMDSQLFSNRRIFLENEINSDTACEFVKKVMLLNEEDNEKNIDVFINSNGGEINAGLLIYDCIQSSKAPIRLFCVGRAGSMAAVLFASGNHGRYMLPHSELMLHEPLIESLGTGNCSSIKSISDSLTNVRDKLNFILTKHTGKSLKEVEEATSYDHFFDVKESIDFGLCDEMISFNNIMEE